MVDEATLLRALVAARQAGVLVCVHAEDGMDAVRRTEETLAAGHTGPAGLSIARPPQIEAAAVRRAAALAAQAGASVYVVHLSSAAGLEAVREARARGAHVLAETCPQYLYLTDRALEGPAQEAANFVCVPPLRGDADREALWHALFEGELDTVSTDHCPFTREDRRRGVHADPGGWANFTQIPGGLPGIETRVALLYAGVRDGALSLERWVDLIAAAPARLFGLAGRKGAVEAGMDADLVVFDPAATRRLDAASLHMRTDHSPYEGMTLTGWPAVTIARGRIVAREGEPADVEPGWGRFVPRKPGLPPPPENGLGS